MARARTRLATLGALVLALALSPAPAKAHGVQVDGAPAEWFGITTSSPDLGRIARGAGEAGEYVWRDAAGDARGPWPGRPGDLLELRVTGDHTRLFIMARLATPVATTGDSVPQLQVAIDLDRLPDLGGTAFTDPSGTLTNGAGAYEWLLETRFGSGQAPRLVNAQGNEVTSQALGAISASGVIELSIPWSDLGHPFVPENAVRFTAALFLSAANDVPLDPADGTASRALDVVTQNAGPGLAGTTQAELADGVAGYAFDVWFGPRGDAIAPIVVSEVFFDSWWWYHWIEIANASRTVVDLGGFKLGDEETPGGSEGMASLPAGTLLMPGESFVVARRGSSFLTEWGVHASAEVVATDGETPDLAAYTPWAAVADFFFLGGDQILVLDGANTVADVLAFGGAAYAGVVPAAWVSSGCSLERRNLGGDTDDCTADFMEQSTPTPFQTAVVAGVGPTSPNGAGLAWAAPYPNPVRGRVTLALRLGAPGRATIGIHDAAGRLVRTLFDGNADPGETRLSWDARGDDGRAVPPGLYFARAATAAGSASVRLAVVR